LLIDILVSCDFVAVLVLPNHIAQRIFLIAALAELNFNLQWDVVELGAVLHKQDANSMSNGAQLLIPDFRCDWVWVLDVQAAEHFAPCIRTVGYAEAKFQVGAVVVLSRLHFRLVNHCIVPSGRNCVHLP
jgi:hypothetical protein